jgi:hypothetical protein
MNPITVQALGAARLADLHREAARDRVRRWAARQERVAKAQTCPGAPMPTRHNGQVEPVDVPDEQALRLSGVPGSALG